MTKTTITVGTVLGILGVGSYILTGMTSVTALIPAFFGVIFIILGVLAIKETRRKLFMHISMGFGLLGLLGSFSGIIKVVSLMSGADVARPVAAYMQAVMAVILIVYLVLGIKSFIDARKTAQ